MKTNSSMPNALGNSMTLQNKLSHLFLKLNSKSFLSLGFLFLSISVVLGHNDISADFDLSSIDTSSSSIDFTASNVEIDNESEVFACAITLQAATVNHDSALITWTINDPDSDISVFRVFRMGGVPYVDLNDNQARSYSISGLTPETTYQVFVQGINGGINQCSSNMVTFTTNAEAPDNPDPIENTQNCPNTISNESNSVVIKSQAAAWDLAKTIIGVSDNTNGSPCAFKIQKDEVGKAYAGYKIVVNLGENNIAAGDKIDIGLDANGVSGNAKLKVFSGSSNSVKLIDHLYGQGQGWASYTKEVVIPDSSSQLVLWLYPNNGSNDTGYSLFDNLIIAKEGSNDGSDNTDGGVDPNQACLILETPVNLTDGTTNLTWSYNGSLSAIDSFYVYGLDNNTDGIAITNLQQTSVNVPTPAARVGGVFILQAKLAGNPICSSSVLFSSATTDTDPNPDPDPDPTNNEPGLWSTSSNTENIYFTGGSVGIGTTSVDSQWQLAVNGNIRAKKIKVETTWADYVFLNDYKLPTLEEVEKHILERGHLINIPSAEEVEANGVELGEMNKLLLEKIEELTLYILKQDKNQKLLEDRVKHLEAKK